nr:hypothetical protein [uncultured Oscillibacter sp.]
MAKRRPSGDGMVRKRDDGRWEGRIVVGHKESGESIFRYIYANTQKELTAKLRQNIQAYQGIDLTEQSRMTLSEWLNQWLDQRMAGTVRGDTLNGYRRDLNNHVKPRLGQKQLAKITPAGQTYLRRPPAILHPAQTRREASPAGKVRSRPVGPHGEMLPCDLPDSVR